MSQQPDQTSNDSPSAPANIPTYAPRRVKKRVRVIPGTDAQVQNALGCIVTPENLPLPMGEITLDFAGWLAERARTEG